MFSTFNPALRHPSFEPHAAGGCCAKASMSIAESKSAVADKSDKFFMALLPTQIRSKLFWHNRTTPLMRRFRACLLQPIAYQSASNTRLMQQVRAPRALTGQGAQ